MAFFVVNDPFEVIVLLDILISAKFHPTPERAEIPGSPLVAALCDRAVEAFAAAQEAGRLPGDPEQTRAFYHSPPESVLAIVGRRVVESANLGGIWNRWSLDERAHLVRIFFRPYVAEESVVYALAGTNTISS